MYPIKPLDKTVKDHLNDSILYPDQVGAVLSLLDSTLGQLTLPTGLGKSVIAAAVSAIKLVELEEKGECGVFSFSSPTKVLGAQLLIGTLVLFAACGIKNVSYLTVNSDVQTMFNRKTRRFLNKALGINIEIERNTTSPEQIAEVVARNKQAGWHTVISATYHSMDRVLKACHAGDFRIDNHTNDEPQNLVTDRFKDLAEPIISDDELDVDMEKFQASIQKYANAVHSLTATPKHTYAIDGIGMQNEDRFGPVLKGSINERQAYETGRKVPPKLVRLDGLDFAITGPKSMGKFVSEVYEQFSTRWTVAKILFDTKGSHQIKWFTESLVRQELIDAGVNVAHCDSVNGHWINNTRYSDSAEWSSALNDLDEDMPLVCLHIEMLVEGLDVPGFNSLMLMKTRTNGALQQLIGRIQRLLDGDRNRLGYGKSFKPENLLDSTVASNFLKPFALVAYHEADTDVGAMLKQLVGIMRTEYGLSNELIAFYTDPEGGGDGSDGTGIEGDKDKDKKQKEIIDVELFKADLVDIDDLYNKGIIDKLEWLKHQARKALDLT